MYMHMYSLNGKVCVHVLMSVMIGWHSFILCVSCFVHLGHVDDAVFNYIRDRMLHSDPHLRPIASEVMSQQFMR